MDRVAERLQRMSPEGRHYTLDALSRHLATAGKKDKIGFPRLLAAISRTYELGAHPQRRVLLFVDNDRAHDAKAVRKLLVRYEERIRIEWLPPYSPELNPQEVIWQRLRRRCPSAALSEHVLTGTV